MKAVIPHISEAELARRCAWGADRRDEVWEGVLHMRPPPQIEHQRFELKLVSWLTQHWESVGLGRVFQQVGVSPLDEGWVDNYRVPDISLLTPERYSIVRTTHLHGGPTAVVELRSPHDETYEKLNFYAQLDVAELWIIEVASRRVEFFKRSAEGYESVAAGEQGWLVSSGTGIELRTRTNCVEIRLASDNSIATEIRT